MPKNSNINFDKNIIKSIVRNIILKTPGVDSDKEISIEVNEKEPTIDVSFNPTHYICNVYDVSRRVQTNVATQLQKQFDLYNNIIRVNVKCKFDEPQL